MHQESSEIEIVRCDDPNLIEHIGRLRAHVWLAEGKLLESKIIDGLWLDELDHNSVSTHYVALRKSEVVAAARLSHFLSLANLPYAREFAPYDLKLRVPYGFISRLVVRKDFRGQGLARRLDLIRLHDAASKGATSVLALPLPYRVEPLKRLGYVYLGPSGLDVLDMDDGLQVPTHVMVHHLDKLPELAFMNRSEKAT
jgi:GNAT superfamily N-acetyltransferase